MFTDEREISFHFDTGFCIELSRLLNLWKIPDNPKKICPDRLVNYPSREILPNENPAKKSEDELVYFSYYREKNSALCLAVILKQSICSDLVGCDQTITRAMMGISEAMIS